MIMRHPHVGKNVFDELQRTFPGSSSHFWGRYESITSDSLPYTLATFYETIRLYPPVPVELKECTSSSTFPDGTAMPIGAIVMWVPWAMGRSKRIWSVDADAFRPERWLIKDDAGTVSLISKTPFEFPVFNGGPRSCLGKKMAESLAISIIASLVWRYNFEEADFEGSGSRPERRSQNSLTLPMENGMPCRVQLIR